MCLGTPRHYTAGWRRFVICFHVRLQPELHALVAFCQCFCTACPLSMGQPSIRNPQSFDKSPFVKKRELHGDIRVPVLLFSCLDFFKYRVHALVTLLLSASPSLNIIRLHITASLSVGLLQKLHYGHGQGCCCPLSPLALTPAKSARSSIILERFIYYMAVCLL